jgi:hypothetical protein
MAQDVGRETQSCVVEEPGSRNIPGLFEHGARCPVKPDIAELGDCGPEILDVLDGPLVK